ncbi:nickel-responsive transcriptional regulator NikR [Brucella thiophenivorans]|uniref:Putative nickel-responsive regulator n=1 Tax=Brucella thiophenivorans TaxID=571255 RepID=A0A256FIV8_9HYPH|nr:nickel-responsive transcriptional regulator NikR [Brucella thiophenivorans]OYR14759.1 nickel-responsive transcriptional regulator NikR [Brucella thiophenivorans]
MQRITITVDDDLMTELDALIAVKGYANRSEAVRDLVRASIKDTAIASDAMSECVGVLSYVYQHEARDLAKKLTTSHHEHHHMSLASLHVHLNEDLCLEVSLLRGEAKAVKEFANSIISQRAVVYGDVSIIPHDSHSHHD